MKQTLFSCLALVSVIGLWGCDWAGQEDLSQFEFTGRTMGTGYHIKFERAANTHAGALQQLVTTELARLNSIFSTYDPTSQLSLLNNNRKTEPIAVSRELAMVLSMAKTISRESAGALDVTIGPVVNLWGFGPAKRVPFEEIENTLPVLMQRVGNELYLVDEDKATVVKREALLTFDLSALAKGYAIDVIYELIRSEGINSLMVEIGGEVRAGGRKADGAAWRAGLERPIADKRSIGWVVSLSNQALATSGDYRNHFHYEGARYSHVIDPRTGRPVPYRNISVSVVHENALLADGWATAFTVLGPKEGMRIAEQQAIAVQYVVGERVFRSSAIRRLNIEAY